MNRTRRPGGSWALRRLGLSAALAALSGCRSIGQIPEIAPGPYAYTYYCGVATQVYQYPVAQVRSSAEQALADLSFCKIVAEPDGPAVILRARTIDGRPTRLRLEPQNGQTLLTGRVGYFGDEFLMRAVLNRIAENFGTSPRFLVPNEPTLSRRVGVQHLPEVPDLPAEIPSPPADPGDLFMPTELPPAPLPPPAEDVMSPDSAANGFPRPWNHWSA